MQLDLFEKNDVNILSEKCDKIKESSDKVRRGIFARYDKLEKRLIETEKKIDLLENELKLLKPNMPFELVG